jgi:hypothetical protein
VTVRPTARNKLVSVFRALLLAVGIFVAGCGSSEDATTQSTVQTDGSLVTYTRTGGVGGIDEHLRIEPGGAATLSYGEPTNSSRSFALTDAELSHITSLLDAADFTSAPAPQPTGCADCFVYTVEAGGHTYTYDDSTPPPAAVGELVGSLGDLAEAHQPEAAGYIKGG